MVLTANVNEEPATDGEEISPSGHENAGDSDDSEGASEPLFVAPDRPRLTDAQKKKVLEKVHAIGSESLPICVIVMNNTSVRLCKSSNSSNSSGPYLTFSKQYVSRYLEKQYFTRHHAKKNVISLVLEREGGSRRWHTELRLGNNRPMIVKGWTSFARDNRLQVDDLCLFKLMRNEETLKMMVYIIRRKKCLA
ncbi:B3 domain-containing protein Os03g0620400-like [Aegilops tauschii subsp. strangulata]